jgi:hypothetical protein
MLPQAANHVATRLCTARVTSCSYRWIFVIQLVQGRVARMVTRGSQGGGLYDKNTYNSATIKNRTHIVINFFYYKFLGNLLLPNAQKSWITQYVFCSYGRMVFQSNIKCVIFMRFSTFCIWIRRYKMC